MISKIRVAVLYQTNFGSISPGGIQNYLYELGKFAPEDFDITYIGTGVRERNLPRPADHYIDLRLARVPLPLSFRFAIAIRRTYLDNFSMVLCHRTETLLFKPLPKNTKIVTFAHGGTFNYLKYKFGFTGLIFPFLELIQLRRSNLLFCVAPKRMQYLVRRSKKSRTAPRIVNRDVFFRDKFNKPRMGIALIGRLETEKRFDLALRIISKAKQKSPTNPIFSKVFVIGEGSLKDRLRELAMELNLDIKFLGQQSSRDIAQILREEISTILITSKFEGFPLVALEAISCGAECVSLKAPGVTEAMRELQQPCFDSVDEIVRYLAESTPNTSFSSSIHRQTLQIDSFYHQLRDLILGS